MNLGWPGFAVAHLGITGWIRVSIRVERKNMEDPIRFILWGKIVPQQREEALSIIRSQAVFPSEMELRKAVSNSLRESRELPISSALGYLAVQELAASLTGTFSGLTYCQESYGPSGGKAFCSAHNFHFGGCLGCHVCQGFYEP